MAEFKVLVLGKGAIADRIAEGAAQAGAAVERSNDYAEGYGLVFLDVSKANAIVKGNVALYQAKGFLDFGKKMEKAIALMPQARLVNQITISGKGILKDKLDETDLERARAFGERTVRNLTGQKFEKHSDKSRIKGYRKA